MICPKCKTENGYYRLETKEWVCRKCAKISPLKVIEVIKQKEDNGVVIQDQAEFENNQKKYIPKEDY